MKRLFKLTVLLVMTTLFSSCASSMRVFVNPESSFSKKNPVTIINKSNKSGALGELQYELQSNGYRIMSLDVAKKALNLDTSTTESGAHSEMTSTTTFNSAYVIDMDGTYYYDPVLGYCFKSFSATITDLVSGEIIMTSKLENGIGDCPVRTAIEMLVKEMNKVIK